MNEQVKKFKTSDFFHSVYYYTGLKTGLLKEAKRND